MTTSRTLLTASLLATTLFTGGCTMTLPVRGQVGDAEETFTGSAIGHMDGAGELAIATTRGARCTGTFVYLSRRQGEGTFNGADGRTGPFRFVSTGRRGTGTGTLSGQLVTFTFGRA